MELLWFIFVLILRFLSNRVLTVTLPIGNPVRSVMRRLTVKMLLVFEHDCCWNAFLQWLRLTTHLFHWMPPFHIIHCIGALSSFLIKHVKHFALNFSSHFIWAYLGWKFFEKFWEKSLNFFQISTHFRIKINSCIQIMIFNDFSFWL